MNDIIAALGAIRDLLAQHSPSRPITLAVTKVDEAMMWCGVQALEDDRVDGEKSQDEN